MVKGFLLLFATSVLEARIITSFLEAAEYQVTEFLASPNNDHSRQPPQFDAAVLVLDNGDTELIDRSAMLRETAHRSELPIVSVMSHKPSKPIDGLHVLLRPIRLFDLVHAVDQAVADSRRARPAESRDFHNQRA